MKKKGKVMTEQARTTRVILSLVAAMVAGALVLMALDKESISPGVFSLSVYTRLNQIEKVVVDSVKTDRQDWQNVEIFYSGTASSSIDKLYTRTAVGGSEHNFHFVITNGINGTDGQIQFTDKWEKQQLCSPSSRFRSQGRTIRICVVSDGLNTIPTDTQIQRTSALIRLFSRQFAIGADNVAYPADWQM